MKQPIEEKKSSFKMEQQLKQQITRHSINDQLPPISANYPWLVAQNPNAESFWHTVTLDADPLTIRFPTFKDRDLYVLANEGELIVFKDLGEKDFSWSILNAEAPPSCCKSLAKYFVMMTSDQRILLVVVGEFGELVEVFKWNDVTNEWEKIDGIGRDMIYICGSTCLCVQAKIPEMENKIFFPRQNSDNGKIVFYSLETCAYHTFTDKIMEENFSSFIGTDNHLNPHAWIEPRWS